MATKVVTIVGARPQFIKAAMVVRGFHKYGDQIDHHLIHTGQHYDHQMSGSFFDELQLPEPEVNLGIGGGTHGQMTGRMLMRLEEVLSAAQPDWVVVYGDTDSTLAGALAAAKLYIPLAHVEAGLRSFNRRMPEEVNRVLTDHASQLLFCPTQTAVNNLAREGIVQHVELVGDVMYDAAVYHRDRVSSSILDGLRVSPRSYFLATCHRSENTDDAERLRCIVAVLEMLGTAAPVLLPIHPRTRLRLEEFKIGVPANVTVLPPCTYASMLALEANAIAVVTDSGGVQKEAYFFGVPCITMRSETEWTETVESGWNTLVGIDPQKALAAAKCAEGVRRLPRPALYGDGDAATKIVSALVSRVQ